MTVKVTMEFTFKSEFDYITFMGNLADLRNRLPFKSCKTIKEVRK